MENPDLKQEVFSVSGFSGIQFKAVGKILLSQGVADSLTIEADPETRSHIHAEVIDGVLRITQDTDWRDWTGFRLIDRGVTTFHIVMKEIKNLAISGVGTLDCAEIISDTLTLTISGPGTMTIGTVQLVSLMAEISGVGSVDIAGKCTDQTVSLSGAAHYKASRLTSTHATVRLSGVGNATVWANESLDAAISGAGSIEYYGEAKVNQKVSGLGVIKYLGAR
jgi:hypothetical protein